MKFASILAALATIGATEARDVKTADGRKTRNVELGIYDDLCIFENADDSWCILATPPMVKAGWEWQQTYTTTPSNEEDVIKYY